MNKIVFDKIKDLLLNNTTSVEMPKNGEFKSILSDRFKDGDGFRAPVNSFVACTTIGYRRALLLMEESEDVFDEFRKKNIDNFISNSAANIAKAIIYGSREVAGFIHKVPSKLNDNKLYIGFYDTRLVGNDEQIYLTLYNMLKEYDITIVKYGDIYVSGFDRIASDDGTHTIMCIKEIEFKLKKEAKDEAAA